ncbi:CoxG family protein [Alkalibacillus aidingensis]|uniref:CoxG family protein n=1 Tax=Alkalibacillus aidingensis TaxID=2747607 RepID=UPI00166082B3|nr:SRPBCC family protein [Alkalibacillus aidingensis]
MPSGTHQVHIDVPIEKVWEFVSEMDNWAPLVPGYQNHKMINPRQSEWTFKGEFGRMHKMVTVRVDIIEWVEPSKVTFNLTGLNEKVVGHGYFRADKIMETSTRISGNLEMSAAGVKGPVLNTVLKSMVPHTSELLTKAVSDKIVKSQVAVK